NGLATYGLDYYELGVQTAEMLVRIIDEDLDPATTPVELANYLELVVNEDYANAIGIDPRSEEHTSELQSRFDLVCRLLLEKKNNTETARTTDQVERE